MIEAQRVARFAMSLLVADTGPSGVVTLLGGGERLWRALVPQGKPLPALTLEVVPLDDLTTANGDHVWQPVLLDIGIHGEGADYGPINAAADRAYQLLQGAAGVHEDVYMPKLRRRTVRNFIDTEAGQSYAHIVQTFYTEAQPT